METKAALYRVFNTIVRITLGILAIFVSSRILIQGWKVLYSSFTIADTGAITKRIVFVPLILVFLIFAAVLVYWLLHKSSKHSNWILPLVLLAGIGLRVAWITIFQTVPESDFQVYYDMAYQISQGDLPPAGKPYMYPFLLSFALLVNPDPSSGRWMNVLFGALTILGVYFLGKKIAGQGAGILASLWMAISPTEIAMTSVLCAEIVTLTFIVAFLYTLYLSSNKDSPNKTRLWIISGLLVSVITSIRPILGLFALLPAAIIIFVSIPKERIKHFTGFAIGLLSILSIILAVHWAKTGELSLKPFLYSSFPLLAGTNMDYQGRFNDVDAALYFSWPEEIRPQMVMELSLQRFASASLPDIARFAWGKIEYLLSDNTYGSLWPFFSVPLPYSPLVISSIKYSVDVISQSWYLLALILITGYLFLGRSNNRQFYWIFLGFVILTVLPFTIFEVQLRYHHVLLPIFSLVSGISLWRLARITGNFLSNRKVAQSTPEFS